jgi:pyruvate/2-oxoglutarate dehydrogenase complex dihydrolipoamide dehydrogenase (E3) component
MKYDYHIIVIGAGSGGLVVASGATSLGARVALVEVDKMGGDCLNVGCVPSKSFLRSAHLAAEIREAKRYGIAASIARINLNDVMRRVRSVIRSIEPHDSAERYEGLGVRVFKGRGKLEDTHTVSVNGRVLTGKYIVIATGSEPAIPPIKGLEMVPYLTNKNIFDLRVLPKKLTVLGGGPIGLELGQGFSQLGTRVEIVDMAGSLFIKDDPEVSPIMEKVLTDEGIALSLSSSILEVRGKRGDIVTTIEKDGKRKEIKSEQVLVSLGRKPVSYGMGLEEVGVALDTKGYIQVNRYLQTSVKNIFACGDVVGPYQFTHMAGYQAGIVIRNIIFPFVKSSVDYSAVPWTTYTRPEVAHVGYTEPWAREVGVFRDAILIDLNGIDRARAEGDVRGFLKLILGKKNRIIGATFVGKRSGEIIPIATMAIRQGLKAIAFMSLIFSYPTEAEIFKYSSIESAKRSFKPWMKSIIQKVLLR